MTFWFGYNCLYNVSIIWSRNPPIRQNDLCDIIISDVQGMIRRYLDSIDVNYDSFCNIFTKGKGKSQVQCSESRLRYEIRQHYQHFGYKVCLDKIGTEFMMSSLAGSSQLERIDQICL